MQNAASTLKLLLFLGLFFVVGGALLYYGCQITPAIGDRTIPLSEWRSRYGLGSAVSRLGEMALLLGLLLSWAVVAGRSRQRRRRQRAAAAHRAAPPEE